MTVEIEMSAAKLLGRSEKGFEIPPLNDPPEDEDTGTTGTGGGTTTTSGGSSSSGSSAPAEPKDPYDAWYTKLASMDKQRVPILQSVYQSLWGEPAPLAVLQAAVEQGLNRWEFEEVQKKNPAWWKTDAAQDSAHPMDLFLEQLGLVPKKNRKKRDNRGGGGGPDPDIEGGPGPDIGPRNKRRRVRPPGYMVGPPEQGPGGGGDTNPGPIGPPEV